MAGSFSDFLELELLDHVFGAAAYTAPTNLHFALFTANPSDSGGGTEVPTGTWSNYARISVTNNATNFPAASAGAKANGTAISWPAATMSGTLTITGMAVFDASTAGNMLAWSDLTTSKSMSNGDTFSIPIGDFDVTLT